MSTNNESLCIEFITGLTAEFEELLNAFGDDPGVGDIKAFFEAQTEGNVNKSVQVVSSVAQEILRVYEYQLKMHAFDTEQFETLTKVAAYKIFVNILLTNQPELKPTLLAYAVTMKQNADLDDDVFMKPGVFDDKVRKFYEHNDSDTLNYGYRLLFEEETVSVDWVEEVTPSGPTHFYTFDEEFLLGIMQKVHDQKHSEVDPLNQVIDAMQNQVEAVVRIADNMSTLAAEVEILEEQPDPRRVFNVSAHVRFFTGRQRELEQIHEHLQQGERCITLSQAATVTGLGGVGKSELARKYAYEYFSEENHNAVWIVAEDAKKLEASFHEVAKTLEIPIMERVNDREQFRSIDSIALDVYPYISNERSLVIFDNVDDYEIIRDLLPWSLYPTQISPFVLITSRKQFGNVERGVSIRTLELNEFSPEEALEFIKKSLGINLEDTSHDGDIETLANRLIFFPLALSQAVAYIRKQKLDKINYSIKDYIQDYDDEEKKILLMQHKHKHDRYERILYTTWSITFEKIEAVPEFGPKAVDIIDTMAYLAPDKIPVETFFKDPTENEDDFWEAVDLLVEYAIIKLERGASNVHRLVQEVLRLWHKSHNKEQAPIQRALNIPGLHQLVGRQYDVHVKSIWNYAYKYEQLFDSFFLSRNLEHVLRILVENDHVQAVESVFKYFESKQINTQHLIEQFLPSAVQCGCTRVLKVFKPNDTIYLFFTEVAGALRSGSISSLQSFVINLKPEEQHVLNTKLFDVSALYFASYATCVKLFKYLIDVGVQFDTKETDYEGNTQLHNVAHYGNLELAKWLIENKCCPDAKNHKGQTALHVAVIYDKIDIVKVLLQSDANIDELDLSGKSPLGYAVQCYYGHLAEFLISRGAQCDIGVDNPELRDTLLETLHDPLPKNMLLYDD